MACSGAFQERFDHLAAVALHKQMALSDVVGEDYDWRYDMDDGRLTFSGPSVRGRSMSFAAQVLGSASDIEGTWMWAWANRASGIPPALTEASRKLMHYGEREMVPELVKPKLPLGDVDAHAVAMVASGLTNASFYYRGPYDGGAVFLLVKDPSFVATASPAVVRAPSVMTQALQLQHPSLTNHEATVIDYLTYLGAKVMRRNTPDGVQILGELDDGEVVAAFDRSGRLLQVNARAHPPSA